MRADHMGTMSGAEALALRLLCVPPPTGEVLGNFEVVIAAKWGRFKGCKSPTASCGGRSWGVDGGGPTLGVIGSC